MSNESAQASSSNSASSSAACSTSSSNGGRYSVLSLSSTSEDEAYYLSGTELETRDFTAKELQDIEALRSFRENHRTPEPKDTWDAYIHEALQRRLGIHRYILAPIDGNNNPVVMALGYFHDGLGKERFAELVEDSEDDIPRVNVYAVTRDPVEQRELIGQRLFFVPGDFYDKHGEPIESLEDEHGKPIRTITLHDADKNPLATRNLIEDDTLTGCRKWLSWILGGAIIVPAFLTGLAYIKEGWDGFEYYLGDDLPTAFEVYIKGSLGTVNGAQAALYAFSVFASLVYFPAFMRRFKRHPKRFAPYAAISIFALLSTGFSIVFNRAADQPDYVIGDVTVVNACLQIYGLQIINLFFMSKEAHFADHLLKTLVIATEHQDRRDIITKLYGLPEEFARGERFKAFVRVLQSLPKEQVAVLAGQLAMQNDYKHVVKAPSVSMSRFFTAFSLFGAAYCFLGMLAEPAITFSDDGIGLALRIILTIAVTFVEGGFFLELGRQSFREACYIPQRMSWLRRQPLILSLLRISFLLLAIALVLPSPVPAVYAAITETALPVLFILICVFGALEVINFRSTVGSFESIIALAQRSGLLPSDPLPGPYDDLQALLPQIAINEEDYPQYQRALRILRGDNEAMTATLGAHRHAQCGEPATSTHCDNLYAFFRSEGPGEDVVAASSDDDVAIAIAAPELTPDPTEESPLINISGSDDNWYNCRGLYCSAL